MDLVFYCPQCERLLCPDKAEMTCPQCQWTGMDPRAKLTNITIQVDGCPTVIYLDDQIEVSAEGVQGILRADPHCDHPHARDEVKRATDQAVREALMKHLDGTEPLTVTAELLAPGDVP